MTKLTTAVRRAHCVVATSAVLGLSVTGGAGAAVTPAQSSLDNALDHDMQQLGSHSGAYVVDLSTGQPLYASAPATARIPASVQKLYTTAVVLLQFGPGARLTTELLGTGHATRGVWAGTLYLRGGGDPTFGSATFDQGAYGTGATMQQLVARVKRRMNLRAVTGRIIGDESVFDSLRGTVESGFAFDPFMKGALSALAFNRDETVNGAAVPNPPAFAARQLAATLRAAEVKVPPNTPIAGGTTPSTARLLTTVPSPPVAKLIALTNTPSDNFFAEMLTKGLGARYGAGGTTAGGTAVMRTQLARRFNLTPYFDDGSGLSRDDGTTPEQVVTLLGDLASNSYFVQSLAVAGETGTLKHEMLGTPAQGNCRAKTGTLQGVASLAGYCQAADKHTLAFAVLANQLVSPTLGHELEADMAVKIAMYGG